MESILKSQVYKANITLSFETIMKQLNDGDIKISKKFRWDEDEIKDMAVSLIKNLPIPPIYCYKNDKHNLIVFDGNQRLMSLFLWYNGICDIDVKFFDGEFYNLSHICGTKSIFTFDGVNISWGDMQDETIRYLKVRYIDFVIVDVKSDYKLDVIDYITKKLN